MIEKKFQKFKESITPQQFSDVRFLKSKAKELEKKEKGLSNRILVRVNQLENQSKVAKEQASNTSVETNEIKTPLKENDKTPSSILNNTKAWFVKSPFVFCVLIPTLLFAFYQCLWASERYESQAQIIIQQPDSLSTMDPSMALLSGMGVSTGSSDTELVKAYIYSNDMLMYLNEELDLRAHYGSDDIDYFSRVHSDDSKESYLEFYKKHIKVNINEKSGVITVFSQAFDADFAHLLTKNIVNRAEWYINSIGHQLAEAQLTFIKGEHQLVEDKLQDAQTKLLRFQQKYNLLDPQAEGLAMQQIAYSLEGQIAAKQTEFKILKSVMSNKAPQVKQLEHELTALISQLKTERNKLAQNSDEELPVSELLSRFTDYQIRMELALKSYTSSQVSLEKSRIEAYRQIKYLIVVESATLPEDNKYPTAFYNISLFLLLLCITYGVGKIIVVTIKELK